jgi:hypothetical protein
MSGKPPEDEANAPALRILKVWAAKPLANPMIGEVNTLAGIPASATPLGSWFLLTLNRWWRPLGGLTTGYGSFIPLETSAKLDSRVKLLLLVFGGPEARKDIRWHGDGQGTLKRAP